MNNININQISKSIPQLLRTFTFLINQFDKIGAEIRREEIRLEGYKYNQVFQMTSMLKLDMLENYYMIYYDIAQIIGDILISLM